MDLRECDSEIAATQRRLNRLAMLRRQMEHDIAEAEREREHDYE